MLMKKILTSVLALLVAAAAGAQSWDGTAGTATWTVGDENSATLTAEIADAVLETSLKVGTDLTVTTYDAANNGGGTMATYQPATSDAGCVETDMVEYTVKMKIEAHNGQLWATNKPLVMDVFRNHLKTIHGEAFTRLDYKDSTAFQSRNLPKAENTLQYFTADNHIKVTIRPSGTEPVLKAYVEVPDSRFRSAEDYEALQQDTQRIQEEIVRELKALLDNHGFIVTKINNKEV